MSFFAKDFLERVKSSKASGVFQLDSKCPKTVNSEQIARVDAAIKQQRIEREKGGWRASAKWLEEHFPEDFAERKVAPASRPSCVARNSEPVSEATSERIAPESPQGVP